MVKIRLRRIGAKGRPFYRVVVSKSTSARNGAFVETLGTYDPVASPKVINVNEERALYWLMQGAQPTETTAYVLKTAGIMAKYFESRPKASANYKFLDRAIAVQASVASKSEPESPSPAPAAVAEVEPEVAPVVADEAPVEAQVEEATGEATE